MPNRNPRLPYDSSIPLEKTRDTTTIREIGGGFIVKGSIGYFAATPLEVLEGPELVMDVISPAIPKGVGFRVTNEGFKPMTTCRH